MVLRGGPREGPERDKVTFQGLFQLPRHWILAAKQSQVSISNREPNPQIPLSLFRGHNGRKSQPAVILAGMCLQCLLLSPVAVCWGCCKAPRRSGFGNRNSLSCSVGAPRRRWCLLRALKEGSVPGSLGMVFPPGGSLCLISSSKDASPVGSGPTPMTSF